MYIIIILLIILFIIFVCKICFAKENYKNIETITILTRTGTRESCFIRLKKSLESQHFHHYKHLISNDNGDNLFLEKENNVIPVEPAIKTFFWECPYNEYLNKLTALADGWIIIIDDDAKFVAPSFLERLSKLCKNTKKENVIIYRIYYGKMKEIRPLNKSLKKGTIDMANICIHSSLLKKYPFGRNCGGDWTLLKQLKNDKVPIVFDKTLPIGVWANTNGKSGGKEIECF